MNIKWFISSTRVLFKYRLYPGISLIGMGIAISSCWFIANYVKNAHQYDIFHPKSDRIYRLTMEVTAGGNTDHFATVGKPPGEILKSDYSGIDAYAKMTFHSNPIVKVNDEVFKERGLFIVNPGTLDVFKLDFLAGGRTTCFSRLNSILLTRSLAEKYFNQIDIIDQVISVDNMEYTVTGVIEDWPENTHLKIGALIYSEMVSESYEPQDWFDLEQYTYVLIDQESNLENLNASLEQLKTDHLAPILEGSGIDVTFHAQALKEIFFDPGLNDDVPNGNALYVNALLFAGILVLLIAGLNYLNLSLTQSTQRSKEIQLKKILGISRSQLFLQNLTESLTMAFLVLMISLILIFIFNNLYFQYTGFTAIDLAGNWALLLVLLLIIIILGLLGSSYSGVYLSFSQVLYIKNKTSVTAFKKVLLGLQYAIASVILISTFTMNRQINFMKNKDLGFTKEHVMVVKLPEEEDLKSQLIPFREQVKNFNSIENASLIGGGALPGQDNGKDIFQVTIDGEKTERVFNIYRIDEYYCTLLNIPFVSGRNFEASRSSDKNNAVIINEALAESMNWDNPVGKTIWYGDEPREVIGVVHSFHNKSLHDVIEPIVFIFSDDSPSNILIKTGIHNPSEDIKSLWLTYFPDTPFELTYFDQFTMEMYLKEDHLASLLGFFSIVSLVLCCMGLFAIFSLQVVQKTKEISIRKVVGANSSDLLKSLTGSYISISVLAFGIAIPIAWFIMDNWLNSFSYKIGMNPWIFILSAFLILFMSFMALMYHILKALHVNPANTLKYE